MKIYLNLSIYKKIPTLKKLQITGCVFVYNELVLKSRKLALTSSLLNV